MDDVKTYYAHTTDGPKNEWQTLDDHLDGVAGFASDFAQPLGFDDWAFLIAWYHDFGKVQPAFQSRLEGMNICVDHSGPGARLLYETVPLAGKLMAYPIIGHHGGMPDGDSGRSKDLEVRLKDAPVLAGDMLKTLPKVPKKLSLPLKPALSAAVGFRMAFFIRMLFSCLVDADFLDTERFCDRNRYEARKTGPCLSVLEKNLSCHMAGFSSDTLINANRAKILSACLTAAEKKPGLFSLTVPTGGGKTLASMAFALKHARIHGHKRVIYVIPFTSIIEQNAAVFRGVLGEEAVIEHHSNFSPDPGENDTERLLSHRLATENWDAPVVVTTNVQFFESLFSNKPSRCRKLHNIANSIIILDEAQMLPTAYLEPCLAALTELAGQYCSTIVFCTATQPALERGEHFKKGIDPADIREIVPDPSAFHHAFKRTRFQYMGPLSNDALAQALRGRRQALAIVNTRNRACDLFQLLGDDSGSFHLSARMCPEHRRKVLLEIRSRLEKKLPCRVIATQLVEAGVDISFPVVYREMAGLDSICQAAGRCNRNGELEGLGDVFVFTPEDGKIPKMFRRHIAAAQSALRGHEDDPFSPEALYEYFKEAYWLCDSLDEKKILPAFERQAREGLFPFRTVSEAFRLIETEMCPVFIPYHENAQRLIEALDQVEHPGTLLRVLQPYSVQVYPHEFNALERAGTIHMAAGLYPVLRYLEPHYDVNMGLVPEAEADPEAFIF